MTGAVSLERIGQIRINVTDLARAVAFYRDVLGMQLLFELPEQGLAFFDCDGVRLYMDAAEPAAEGSTPGIYYRVRGLDGAHESLVAQGVDFVHEPYTVYTTGGVEGRMAFFHDSEGNLVALMEETPVASGAGG